MYGHLFHGSDWTALPQLALLLFLATFVAIVIRVSLRSQRKDLDAASLLPFDEKDRPSSAAPPAREGRNVR